MKVQGLNSVHTSMRAQAFSAVSKKNNTNVDKKLTGMNGDKLVMEGKASEFFDVVENLSNPKVGSKFVIQPKMPDYKNLKMLITPESKLSSFDFSIQIKNEEKEANNPSFKGRLYGSIRQDSPENKDYTMQGEYIRFWMEGMHKEVTRSYSDMKYAPKLKDDYNFFIPSDGDGTRYKDVTGLQGGRTKPASYIPATLNGKQMSLVQGVITNFAKTSKLDKMFDFVNVKPAQGSAYAFLEGLKENKIHTDKPLVFSWGDNFSDVNVSRLMYNHEQGNSGFTVTVIPVDKERTKALSIIKTDSPESRKIDIFEEKPQDDKFIDSCVLPELGENKCLSAVGPYILSPEALEWIKTRYVEDPESFRNPDKGFDFSSMIIAPMLNAFNNGEIVSKKTGEPLEMKFDTILPSETWSDLGAQKDLSKAMKDLRKGAYHNLPEEMRWSLCDNVDTKGNITFNEDSQALFKSMCRKMAIEAENVIAYCKQE